MGGSGIAAAWRWLDYYSGPVGVVVVAVYAALTLGLWLSMRRQAETTRRMFVAAYRPHLRVVPDYGSCYWAGDGHERVYSFGFLAKSYGHGPAVLTSWEVRVASTEDFAQTAESRTELSPPGWRAVMYPDEPTTAFLQIRSPKDGQLLGPDPSGEPTCAPDASVRVVWVQCTVTYRGDTGHHFLTRVRFAGSFPNWRLVEYTAG